MSPSPSVTQEQAILSLAKQRPLLRARDVTSLGVPTAILSRLVTAGKLERVARGVYSLPRRRLSAHRSLAEVALRAPQGVVCLLSALRLHEIGTQSPFEVWLAVPNNVPTPRLDQPALRVVRMSGPALTEGVEITEIDGVQVRVFSAAKTIADCFKYRNKIGIDVAVQALRDYSRRYRGGATELARFARICRVTRVMQPYLDAIS